MRRSFYRHVVPGAIRPVPFSITFALRGTLVACDITRRMALQSGVDSLFRRNELPSSYAAAILSCARNESPSQYRDIPSGVTMSDRDSVAERRAPPDRFSGIEALCDRGSRIEDFKAENRALVILAHELASNPRNVLPRSWPRSALELCRADSAGISIFGSDGTCRWHACAGLVAGASTERKVLSTSMRYHRCSSRPVLLQNPASLFPPSLDIHPPVTEALLLPFYEEEQPAGPYGCGPFGRAGI